ncbi:S41 family peptidase [Candidatus Kuenenbacteria bacterium]|nr:S41 family peptidase [Candidatus Kuenenbacteria bacterium]
MENGYKNKNKNVKKTIIVLFILVILGVFFAGGFIIGKLTDGKINYKVNPDLYKQTKLPEVFDSGLIKQVWTIIQNDFVDKDKISEEDLYYGALKGFVAGLDDPYTVLFEPQTAKDFDDQIAGEFQGIGAEIGIKDGIVTIIAPLPDTPADKAGVMAGDKVFAVDDQEIFGMGLDEVVHLIRGEKGTPVKLLIVRGEEVAQEITIVRGVIELKSVKWEFRNDGLVYLEVNAFNGDTNKLFNEFVLEVKNRKPKGIIFDMRNNPGGLLETALDISSMWIENELIAIEKFGDGREIEYSAGKSAALKDYKTVILINQGSASGSEIVAGAFQDYNIAKIVGMTSFGKGSVQALKKLPDGSSIKITIAKWLTPKGKNINEEGIIPDVEIDLTKEDFLAEKDPQLDKAVEILLAK